MVQIMNLTITGTRTSTRSLETKVMSIYLISEMIFRGTATWKSGTECELPIKGKNIVIHQDYNFNSYRSSIKALPHI